MAEHEAKASGRKVVARAATAIFLFCLVALGLVFLQPEALYLWIKALHVIAVISWMAGMLYMPRLFIYHLDAPLGSQQAETFSVMEQRLLKIIMRPAMVIAWILGLYLAWEGFAFMGGWLHVKLAAVLALSAVHGYFARAVAAFARGNYMKTARFWRLMNEVPTILMIVIVIMVIVKPL
ncbi:protoporphyrinogen oxidase HemJ [Ciceribacter azotifigens]|uniref:protoporphyrinogen oxidase HemJ n=1 Tax=Ciceribacter azotifigens TaxID=2069303 RepID=UPI003A8BA4B6